MLSNINSLVLVTSIEMILQNQSEIVNFFNSIDTEQKNSIIFSPKPILDYSSIKKIPANKMIIIHQKDFFPLNILIKPNVSKILSKANYSVLVHFNEDKFLRNTYLIAKTITADIKITNSTSYPKLFSVVIQDKEKFFHHLLDYLNKLVI